MARSDGCSSGLEALLLALLGVALRPGGIRGRWPTMATDETGANRSMWGGGGGAGLEWEGGRARAGGGVRPFRWRLRLSSRLIAQSSLAVCARGAGATKDLDRKYQAMERDRKSYTDESQNVIRKQRCVLPRVLCGRL